MERARLALSQPFGHGRNVPTILDRSHPNARSTRSDADPMKQPWRVKAACLGLDPSTFYPDPDDDSAAEPAKAVCATCAVRELCLEYALGYREKEGVFFFSSRRRHTRFDCDWSSDVCSSD